MIEPKILLCCNIKEDQLFIEDEVSSSLQTNDAIAKSIDSLWRIKQKEAALQGRKLWNSVAYRLEHFRLVGSNLYLQFSTIEYKEFIALRAVEMLPTLGENYYPKFVFVTSLIHTSDDKYVFGKAGKSYTDLDTDTIGGGVIKSEGTVTKGSELFNVLYREFKEEINLDSSDIISSSLRGIMLSPWYGIGCFFYTQLCIPSTRVMENFLQSNDDEIQELVFIERENIKTFLETLGGYKPLINAMQLW